MITDPRLTYFGAHVRTHRAAQGMTQAELAAKVGLTRSSTANMEAGRQSPPLVVALDLAKELGTTLAVLTGEAPDPVTEQMAEVLGEIGELETAASEAQKALAAARKKIRTMRLPADPAVVIAPRRVVS